MHTHAERTQQNKNQPAANKFANDRPDAIAQRRSAKDTNNSFNVRQLRAYQEIANSGLQVKQLQVFQAMPEEETLQGGLQKKEVDTPTEAITRFSPIQKKPNNTGLPDNLKTGIEHLGGYSMDDVKVHYNSAQPAQLHALAYAQGTDIHIGPGQEKHLPHEAWHVVQQKQNRVRPTIQMKGGIPVNDDAGLEAESDVMGARALGMSGAAVQRLGSSHVQLKGWQPGEGQASAVFQLHRVVPDPRHWTEPDMQALFKHVPELNEMRESLIGIDVEDWTWDLKERCIALVRQHPELPALIKKYIEAENQRRAQFSGLLRDVNPDDIEDHIIMIAAKIRWTLKVIGSGEFEDEPGPVDLHEPGKKPTDIGSLKSSSSEEASLGKDDDSDDGAPPGPIAPRPLVPRPRLPGRRAAKRSPEENAKELQQFEQNIAQLAILVAAVKPAVVEQHELLINAALAKVSDTEGTTKHDRITLAYNLLPVDAADYWKTCVAHESLLEGLELIVRKAKEPKGYTVDIAKFNALFPSLISRNPEELMTAVQSLMRLAPNTQDLMETTVNGSMRETTGINCGKTIPKGFNTAVEELTPPPSAIRLMCDAANKNIMEGIMAACMLQTQGRGDLPDGVRKALIEKILTIHLSGAGSISVLMPCVTPNAVALIVDTLHAMYTQEAIIGACKLELNKLATAMTIVGPMGVKAFNELERLSGELQLEDMYALIGDNFFSDSLLVVTPEVLIKIAVGGGLLCVSSDSEKEYAATGGAKGADIFTSGTKASYPKTLGELVELTPGLSGTTNLYFKGNNTFSSKGGFYDEGENFLAKNKLRQALHAMAIQVLKLYMPPTAVHEIVSQALKNLRQKKGEYTLTDAIDDFDLFFRSVTMAIAMHLSEHDAFQ
jgi:hypothetical protein